VHLQQVCQHQELISQLEELHQLTQHLPGVASMALLDHSLM
jgi:hypothetical protein